jgi:acyl transferase domain-containing protein
LVTALQLCLVAVLESWGITPSAVVGHSSGEIAAAYAAGLLDRASAIKAAFYRGRAAVHCKAQGLTQENVGMLAVGLGAEAVTPFLDKFASNAWIACHNSPSSVTVSGGKTTLEALAGDIKAAGHFARLLQVDLAYHSPLMAAIGDEYQRLLDADPDFKSTVAEGAEADKAHVPRMFSSVTRARKASPADAKYWKNNMVSAVRFSEALEGLVAAEAPAVLVELGPSGALAGPVSQVLKSQASGGVISYTAAWSRGSGAPKALMDLAGRLFLAGAPVDMAIVNAYSQSKVRTIVDLPNYRWNHSARYWHENAASADWRTKRFITHDLLGSKIPGTSWKAPTWRKKLRLADVPWLRDHRMGPDVLIPGTAFAAMALEAMFQKHCATHPDDTAGISSPNQLAYRFRNIKFDRAVVLEDSQPTDLVVTLASIPGNAAWHEFRIRTTTASHDVIYEHCSGLVRVHEELGDDYALHGEQLAPLRHPQSPAPWYKLQTSIGTHFGPSFQKIKQWESLSGQHHCRATMSLEPPASKWNPQTYYPIHPAVLDACLQTSTPAILAGERSTLKDVMILARIDDMVINKVPRDLHDGLSVAEAIWTGRGRKEKSQSWATNVDIHDPSTGALFLRVRGLEHVRLDVEEKPDPHVFQAVHWKADISCITQDQLLYSLTAPDQGTQLDTVLDLVAHKTPRLSVLEIDLDGQEDASTLWLHAADAASQAARSAAQRYDFASPNAQVLVAVEAAHASPNAAFHLLATGSPSLGLPENESYDLIIVRAMTKTAALDALAVQVKPLVRTSGCMLMVFGQGDDHGKITATSRWQSQSDEELADSSAFSGSGDGSESSSLASSPVLVRPGSHSISTGYSSVAMYSPRKPFEADENGIEGLDQDVRVLSLPGLLRIDNRDQQANLYHSSTHVSQSPREMRRLIVARFDKNAPPLGPALRAALTASGWSVKMASAQDISSSSTSLIKEASVILVVDELVKPVLTTISPENWDTLKRLLIGSGKPVLWVTKGAQTTRVSEPDNALVQGLFRVIRREDPAARLVTLDVQSPASPAAHWAVQQVLRQLADHLDLDGTLTETEYAERDGILMVPRVMPDKRLNDFRVAERGTGTGTGHELVVKEMHTNPSQVRLQADKIGTLQSLHWCETATGQVPIEPGKVEIEVRAVGVNFKASDPV